MNNNSRIANSLKNINNGLISQALSLIFNFIVRTVFITYLSKEYLGISGLFTNILTILSLAELGFGSAIVYSMYKPLAENNEKKIQAIMNFYKKVYRNIGIIVGIIGICIIPFMDYIIKDKPDINNLILIYIIYLANSVASYFFAYKRSILTADQKEYILSRYKYIFIAIKSVAQIIILAIFKSFILYLIIQIVITVAENIFISIKVDKIYPFLSKKNNEKLSLEELKSIKDDVSALVLAKFGNVMLNGTDNIIISSFIGVDWVGVLSNYTLITGSIVMVLSQITASITGSVGNFIAKEKLESRYEFFNRVDFFYFWIYGFSTICLMILLNPFIELWIGTDYLVNQSTVNVLGINFFISGIMSLFWTFRSTMGLFTQGKYRPLIAAFLNIIISIILGKYIGIIGVLLGTTISRLLVNLIFDPYIIHKYGLNKSVINYYLNYLFRIVILISIYICMNLIKLSIFYNGINIVKFMGLMIICIFVPNIILVIIYKNSYELNYIKNICKKVINKLKIVVLKRIKV